MLIQCAVRENLEKSFEMKISALYVPTLGSNLFSVKKLTQDGYKLVFFGEYCYIVKDGQLRATAALSQDLYELKTINRVSDRACVAAAPVESHFSKAHGDNCLHVWHRIFGHRDVAAIKHLADKELVTGIIMKDCGGQ